MHPDALTLWRGPRWALALLLAGLSMLGPFAIDTYLPAFAGIAQALAATPVQMQQTLSAYLIGFALLNLFHGALSDSVGRRPVVLAGIAVFTLASAGCALAQTIGQLVLCRALQGMSAGAGMVVARAIIRDLYPPADAQRVMAQVTIWFGLAPAVAPLVGGWLYVGIGWRAVFWLLVGLSAGLWLVAWRRLPESLHATQRQQLHLAALLRGYARLGIDPRFVTLVLASGIPFNGMFLYVLSAPAWLGGVLQLQPTQFFWFFVCSVGGIMGGSALSGRLAGRVPPKRQIRFGFAIMLVTSCANVALSLALPPHPTWAIATVSVFAFGWALMVPVVTLLVLDLVPERRGMAASMQACVGSAANALVAGAVAPLVMHSAPALALTSIGFLLVGLVAWTWVRPRLA